MLSPLESALTKNTGGGLPRPMPHSPSQPIGCPARACVLFSATYALCWLERTPLSLFSSSASALFASQQGVGVHTPHSRFGISVRALAPRCSSFLLPFWTGVWLWTRRLHARCSSVPHTGRRSLATLALPHALHRNRGGHKHHIPMLRSRQNPLVQVQLRRLIHRSPVAGRWPPSYGAVR